MWIGFGDTQCACIDIWYHNMYNSVWVYATTCINTRDGERCWYCALGGCACKWKRHFWWCGAGCSWPASVRSTILALLLGCGNQGYPLPTYNCSAAECRWSHARRLVSTKQPMILVEKRIWVHMWKLYHLHIIFNTCNHWSKQNKTSSPWVVGCSPV